jgi:serine/threonine-protein kinase
MATIPRPEHTVTAIEIPTPDPRTFDETTRPFAETVSAQFAVKRLIGRGGMGMVFLARDRRLDRMVAIKTLPPNLASDPAVRERFLRETRTAGGLAHQNIVPIHGADEIGGHVYFVMTYVDGESLATHTRASGRLPAPAVGRYLRDVAAALSYAHQRGIIHRDIKAENILIERATDRALVTDFGIARLAEATPLTITGQVLGTVHYVSPEQVSGDTIDARSDIYSLGVVGFFALTGSFPFDAEVASAVLVQHVTRTAPPVASVNRDVPSALASIVDRCLMKDPAHRFSTADELQAALESALPLLGRPSVVSDTAAHSVWARAAELQANTGIEPRPAAVTRPRPQTPPKKSGAPSPGFRIDDVVSAAAEAGIDERYVDRALAEQGLAGPVVATPPAPVKTPAPGAPRKRFWSMARFDTAFEAEVKGELPAREIDRLLTVLRDQTGKLGTTVARTRELAWDAGSLGSTLDVSVVPSDGRTRVALVRHMRRRVLAAITVASVAGGLITMGAIGVPLAEGVDEGLGILIGLIGGVTVAMKLGGVLVKAFLARSMQRVHALGDVVATKVRESIG